MRNIYLVLQLLICVNGLNHEIATMAEDVVGNYELNAIRVLLMNSTKKVDQKLTSIADAIDANQKSDSYINKLSDSVAEKNNKFIGEMYSQLGNSISSFINEFSKSMSNLKVFAEHKSDEMQTILRKTELAADKTMAEDCFNLYKLGYNATGTYWLQKFGIRVLCDMETDGGGWLVIQRRTQVTNQVDFQRDWFTYKEGFGDLDTEFWIGNDMLHVLTNQKNYELRIDMEDFENGTFYASYSEFRVGNEKSSYELHIGNYTGNATDAFTYHHQRKFSTIDRDNDNYEEGNCAKHFSGGFWYDRCYDAHLNGVFPSHPDRIDSKFITWFARSKGDDKNPLVLINVNVKIRPKIF